MRKVGFIGLGIMGLPMATNIMNKSGCDVTGFDVMEAARERFVANGGKVTANADEIYAESDVIFLCLPKNELVDSTVREIIAKAKSGTIIVDFSSTAPGVIRTLFPLVKEVGMELLDSPISGGEAGAIAGTLVVMCGGERETFDKVEDLLHCVGSTATYMGSTGCGCVAKLANNMIVGINLVAVGEAYTYAAKAGLEPTVLFAAIKGGFAQNAVMDMKVPKILSRDFSPSARIAVHHKDIKNAMQLANEMGVELPLSAVVLDHMNRMEEWGMIDEDQCALVKVFEKAMNVEVK